MTILFDLDGTLLDTVHDIVLCVNELRAERGEPKLTHEFLRPAISHGLVDIIRLSFGISIEDPAYQPLATQLLAAYENKMGQLTQPFPGILNLLSTLDQHEITWGIVTNRSTRFTEILLEAVQLKSRPACLVCGDSTPNPKPHPDPLLLACDKIGALPKNCLYIGDAEIDVQAGKAAGMKTLNVLFGYIPDRTIALQWGADHYVDHADEIFPWILNWQNQKSQNGS